MTKKTILTSLIICLTFSLNAQNWWGDGTKIKGNGNVITTNRSVANFEGISVGGSFDVMLIKGKEGLLKIEGEENIIPYIETIVIKNSLKIRFKKNTNVYTTKKLIVTVFYDSLEKISLGGSGSINNEGTFKGDALKINLAGSGDINLEVETDEVSSSISGSGTIKLKGTTTMLNGAITGSGSIKAYELTSNELSAKITGSGNIKNTVLKKIKAKVIGSGSIYYKGNPTHIDSKTIGSGDVIDRN